MHSPDSSVAHVNGGLGLTLCRRIGIDPPWVWLAGSSSVFGEEFAAGSGAVGVASEGQDLGVVHQAVDHGRGHDVVGEGLSPCAIASRAIHLLAMSSA